MAEIARLTVSVDSSEMQAFSERLDRLVDLASQEDCEAIVVFADDLKARNDLVRVKTISPELFAMEINPDLLARVSELEARYAQ